MDWEACIICGTSIGELRCPANSLQGNGLSIYEIFLANVNGFKKINLLPASVNFEEDTTSQCLYDDHAKWHKSSHLKFAGSILLRAQSSQKRKNGNKTDNESDTDGARKSSRLSLGTPRKDMCLFCAYSTTGSLHNCEFWSIEKTI